MICAYISADDKEYVQGVSDTHDLKYKHKNCSQLNGGKSSTVSRIPLFHS
jgi:hypothetical protein